MHPARVAQACQASRSGRLKLQAKQTARGAVSSASPQKTPLTERSWFRLTKKAGQSAADGEGGRWVLVCPSRALGSNYI